MICVYGLPVARGTLLVLPPAALEQVRALGYLLERWPGGLAIHVLTPAPPADADRGALARGARLLLRRAVVSATLGVERPATPGPHGRWYGALLAWGWLLVLFAGGSALQALGGLWLAAGLPLTRRAVRRRMATMQTASASGYTTALGLAPDGPQVTFDAYAPLRALAESAAGDDGAGTRFDQLAGRCERAGLPALAAVFRGFEAGTLPPGVWCVVPSQQASLDAGAALPEMSAAPAGPEPAVPAAEGER